MLVSSIILSMILASCGSGGSDDTTSEVPQNTQTENVPDSIKVPSGYNLVWHDEFDETTLSKDWTIEVQPQGWVNNELQNYVNDERTANISEGNLNITCLKVDGRILSGRLYAKVDEGWKYGYFEAKIKLPKGKGTWPAFWMMPANNDFSSNPWPGCGEIDIMEEVGVDSGYVSSTIHCNKYNNSNTTIEHGSKYLSTAESDYHIYACEWTAEDLNFYVDGTQILSYQNDGSGVNSWPFDKRFYLILNLAWGGSWGGYNGVDENALPTTMKVAYVRVFQKK